MVCNVSMGKKKPWTTAERYVLEGFLGALLAYNAHRYFFHVAFGGTRNSYLSRIHNVTQLSSQFHIVYVCAIYKMFLHLAGQYTIIKDINSIYTSDCFLKTPQICDFYLMSVIFISHVMGQCPLQLVFYQ